MAAIQREHEIYYQQLIRERLQYQIQFEELSMRQEMQAEQRTQLQVELSNKINQNMQLIEELQLKESKMLERHEADIAFKLQC